MNLSDLVCESRFTVLDWTIVALYLLGTLGIGIWVNRYVKGMSDYVVAGRSLNSSIAIATMIGSELGLVTVMYSAQKGLTGGFSAFHIGLVAGVATLVIGFTGFIVVPLRKMEVLTIPEFYERRFGRRVRIFGGLILALSGILNMGLFLKAGALFVTGLCGLTDPLAVNLVMTALIVLVLAYTILGGMVSVVITDYIQFCVLSFGMILACVLAILELGWDTILTTVDTAYGPRGFNPFHEQGYGPSYVIWMIFTAGIVSCAVWQTAVMRACSATSTQVVKRLYIWSSIGFLVRFVLPSFLGLCALTYFWTRHGVRTGWDDPTAGMSAMPTFLAQILPIGLLGIIAAGMLAAFMSTHDSYLLCWASVLAHDVVAPLTNNTLKPRHEILLARIFIFLIGLFLLTWSLWFPLGQDLWDYMAITGSIYFTGAFALLLCGLYWPRASSTGATLALAAGSCSLLGLQPIRKALGHSIPSEDLGLATVSLALVLMVVGSLLRPDRPKQQSQSDPQSASVERTQS